MSGLGSPGVPPFITRLIDEEKALKQKIDSLEIFLTSKVFEALSATHRIMLAAQLDAMRAYYKILSYRTEIHLRETGAKRGGTAAPDVTQDEADAGILEVKTTGGGADETPVPFKGAE